MLCLNEEHRDSDGNKRKTHEKNLRVSKKQLIEANQVQSKGFVSVCVCVLGAEISGALQLD